MQLDLDTLIGINFIAYSAKLVIALGMPFEQMATDYHNQNKLFRLRYEYEDGNEKVLPEMRRLEKEIRVREETQEEALKFALLPTPLDVIYLAYRLGKSVRDYCGRKGLSNLQLE